MSDYTSAAPSIIERETITVAPETSALTYRDPGILLLIIALGLAALLLFGFVFFQA